jgi:hypothetical protein
MLITVLLGACGVDESKPYFTFAGGGFIFNYRNADAYYGFVLKAGRATPEGAVIEVTFEMPDGSDVQTVPVRQGQLQYMFRSPDMDRFVKDKSYEAVVRVLDGEKEIARLTKSFKNVIDPSQFPSEPLVVGPGYQKNPDARQ